MCMYKKGILHFDVRVRLCLQRCCSKSLHAHHTTTRTRRWIFFIFKPHALALSLFLCCHGYACKHDAVMPHSTDITNHCATRVDTRSAFSPPHTSFTPPSVTGEDDTKTRAKKEKATGGGDAHTSGVVWELCVNLARDGLVDVVELIFVVLKLLGRHGAPATPRHHPCCVQSERCQSC